MEAEVLGIEHVYLSVRSLERSQRFYDQMLVEVLGFRRSDFQFGGDPHSHYFNRHFGVVIRPAHPATPAHDARAPGLHHLCLRVEDEAAVERVAHALDARGLQATPARRFHEYAPDYVATFVLDPDGIRLEVTNFRAERRARMLGWDDDPDATGATEGRERVGQGVLAPT
jgi:catechol 2,3-dioxygenase-like lactoylglutathione lyase family enzyme